MVTWSCRPKPGRAKSHQMFADRRASRNASAGTSWSGGTASSRTASPITAWPRAGARGRTPDSNALHKRPTTVGADTRPGSSEWSATFAAGAADLAQPVLQHDVPPVVRIGTDILTRELDVALHGRRQECPHLLEPLQLELGPIAEGTLTKIIDLPRFDLVEVATLGATSPAPPSFHRPSVAQYQWRSPRASASPITRGSDGANATESFDPSDGLWTRRWLTIGGIRRERRDEHDKHRTLERAEEAARSTRRLRGSSEPTGRPSTSSTCLETGPVLARRTRGPTARRGRSGCRG